jgi:hypothetical protein
MGNILAGDSELHLLFSITNTLLSFGHLASTMSKAALLDTAPSRPGGTCDASAVAGSPQIAVEARFESNHHSLFKDGSSFAFARFSPSIAVRAEMLALARKESEGAVLALSTECSREGDC